MIRCTFTNDPRGNLVEPHVPAPRQELSADEVRERILALAPSTLELRKRLNEARE